MKPNFSDRLKDSVLLFDGAMGTMLQGNYTGSNPELLNLTNPRLVEDIHRAYVAAGSDIVTANTFGANSYKLAGTGHSVDAVVGAAIGCARRSGACFVALDIGPIGQLLKPAGTLDFESAVSMFAEPIRAGAANGADCVLIETMSDLYEAKAAIVAAKEHCKLPILVSLSFDERNRTFMGCDALTAVVFFNAIGVDAIGVNCSQSPSSIAPIVDTFLRYANVPVLVMPNAGLPKADADGHDFYDVSATQFAEILSAYHKRGARLFGGCCGTTPTHIAELSRVIGRSKPLPCDTVVVTAVTSGIQTVIFDEEITVIGERLNPTGKPKLKEAIKHADVSFVVGEALAQVDAGAHILDLNCGLPEVNELEVIAFLTEQLQSVVSIPIQIDSANPAAIERAVRLYNGKPLINSVNGAADSMERVFPIVKKYGAAVIGLTLDENGIPSKAEERLWIAERIVKTAQSYGIAREDILIDCLVLTVSAQQEQVIETIKAIRLVKEKLGVKTVLGVSNVSFGLPNRPFLNSIFLTAALSAGLDAAIVNPMSDEVNGAIKAFRVLNGKDRGAVEYMRFFDRNMQGRPLQVSPPATALNELVASGQRQASVCMAKELSARHDPMFIINTFLIPALDAVGKDYESGRLFLPQLIAAAEAAKACFDVLKDKISVKESVGKGAVILAAVKGDIHDIGKNIVSVLLQSYGYRVLDLGKDVEPDLVAQTAKRENARLVGLSALMTTTIPAMKTTVEKVRLAVPDACIVVGGAVMNDEYAKLVGADYYAPDAMAGVRIAEMILGNKSRENRK